MADYGAQDTSTTTLVANQFPISEVWTPNSGFSAVEGGTQSTDGGGKKSAPVNVNIKNANANGQATMTNSAPVTIASDQSSVATKLSTTTLFTTTQTAQGSGNSGDLAVSSLHEVSIDINTTAQAGTSPTIQFFYERKGADGIYYILWQTVVLTVASNTISTSIGPGLAYNQSLGLTGRLRWVVGGTATPTWTFTPNVYGK